jgi:lipoyl(octanoyl) transferase
MSSLSSSLGLSAELNPKPALRRCRVELHGQVAYQTAWEWQKQLVAAKREYLILAPAPEPPELEDRLILLEHPPVYTLGQGASLEFLKFDPAQAPELLYRTERGGEVTYHCPGQLVGYPILNLKHYRPDLHWYLRQLEEVLIRVLALYGLTGERISGLTGVWVEGCKLAAIGIKVSRWITMHGFALNVCPDLSGFEQIVPCGIAHRPIGSMAQFVPEVNLAKVQMQVVGCFAEVFQVEAILESPR